MIQSNRRKHYSGFKTKAPFSLLPLSPSTLFLTVSVLSLIVRPLTCCVSVCGHVSPCELKCPIHCQLKQFNFKSFSEGQEGMPIRDKTNVPKTSTIHFVILAIMWT